MDGVTEGRITHYVMKGGANITPALGQNDGVIGEHRPAIIVKVNDAEDTVNLQVFCDGSNDGVPRGILWVTDVQFDEHSKKPGSWHWIERA